MNDPLLSVEGLRVEFETPHGVVRAVDRISFTVAPGQTLVLLGESGAGKTDASLAVLGLNRGPGARIEGRIMFGGQDLAALDEDGLRRIRGSDISIITRDPPSSLHPLHRLGAQMIEAIRAHRAVSTAAARDRAIDLLELVGIPDPHRRVNAYPHELSRGALTRVVIAMALANAPKLLIADEPTATLDITVQAQILALLEELQERLGVAILFVTRDLGVAAQVADEVVVMYAGRIVEQAPAEEIFATPQHPYTWGLLRSMPGVARPREGAPPIPGVAPSPINLPAGCVFHPRCPYARDFHGRVIPQLALVDPEGGHRVACLLEAPVRSRIWEGLLAGQTPEALAALVDLEPAPEAGP